MSNRTTWVVSIFRNPRHHTVRPHVIASAILVLAACSGRGAPSAGPVGPDTAILAEDFSGRTFLPANNWWNLDISVAPLDPQSDTLINFIRGRTAANPGADRRMHPDFGPPPYGIPYIGVSANEPLSPVTWTHYGNQSDDGAPGAPPGYPIPRAARTRAGWIEGGVAGGGNSGDRHLLLVDRDRDLLFETWYTRWNAGAGRWEAGSGAVFDLSSNARRPEGWTSADAAGLAIFPGLVRYDEAVRNAPITHAFRVTVRATNGYEWPASHAAGSTPGAPPMGMRLRLKAGVDISAHPPEVRRILQAMKTYGLIVADNGSDMYVSGTMDPRWNNGVLNPAFHALNASDFEVVMRGWGTPAVAATRPLGP